MGKVTGFRISVRNDCKRKSLKMSYRRRLVSNDLCFIVLLLCFALFIPAIAWAATSGISLGSTPSDIAVNSYTNTAVVTTQTGVDIVDLNAQSVTSTLSVPGAQNVAIDTGLNIAFVTDSSNNLSIIDLSSLSVTSKTAFSEPITGIAVNPANHTAVLLTNNSTSSDAVIWDMQTQATIATVPIKGSGTGVAVDPALGLAVTVGQKFISVIDLSSGQIVQQLTSGVNQTAVSINPETHLAAIADKGSDTLTILNLQTWQSSSVSVPKHPMYVAANPLDNEALVVSIPNQSNGGVVMSLVDMNSDSIIESYTVNSLTKGVAVNNFTNIAGLVDDQTNGLNLIQLPNPVPAIGLANPTTLFRGGSGQTIAVNGNGFIETTSATIQDGLGNSYLVTPVFTDNYNISLSVPVAALANTGSLQVTVTNPVPGGGLSNASSVGVINPVPAISSLVPLSVTAGGQSQELDVLGSGFFGDTTFFVNGTQWPSTYDSYLKAHLNFSAPDLAYGRYYSIGAFNPLPGGGNSNNMTFTVLNPMPIVNGLVPDSTLYETAASIIVNGSGFVPTSQVQFNGTSLPFTYTNWNTLNVNIPAGLVNSVGNYGLNVINPAPGGGTSNAMNLAVLPRPITITPDNKTITYGDPAPAFTYTITSGALVNGDSLGTPVYTFNGSTTVPTQAGTYTIGITGLSNPDYAITNATGVFTINPRPITVTADPQTKVYGSADPALTYKITSGALVGSDAFTGALTRAAGENVGPYAIQQGTLSLGGNYALTYVGANLTITQKPATVTPNAASKTYGQTDPLLTGALSGFLISDNVTAVFTRTTGENAGTYAISAVLSPATVLPNYSITYNTATFTINNPAPVLGRLMPSTISPNTAATVVINGTGFVPTSAAYFDGVGVATTYASGGSLSIAIPAALATTGNHNITVTNPTPSGTTGGGTSNALPISVKTPYLPDPSTIAPPIDPTAATTIASSTAFLYTGPNAIQNGVAPGTIQTSFAAVIRGKVMNPDGTPLPGVNITILGHPEFGGTQSRADGMFDMAVNGGSVLTINYQKTGYFTIQHQVNVPWQDYAQAPDAVLIQPDSAATPINLASSAPIQVARGNSVTDSSGTRQATLMFNQGTTATMVMPDGTRQPITNLTVRATEFTAGPNGVAAMPGLLPPNVGYTYAVDYSADEEPAGGAEIYFSQPVISYTENFLNFYVGSTVPVASYDPTKGAWIPQNNGRVIKILSISNGVASIDVDGNGSPANSTELSNLGVTTAELQQLATLYQPGQSLWRVPIPHFSQTPYDFNQGDATTTGATTPGQLGGTPTIQTVSCPLKTTGCILEVQNQTLGETINIAGTPFSLNYRSSLQPGRIDDQSLNMPLSGATLPPGVQNIVLEVDVAGQAYHLTFPPSANQTYSFTWNGLDAYGRPMQGSQPVTTKLGYVYKSVYTVPAALSYPAFGHFSYYGTPVSTDYARQNITLWQTNQSTVSSPSMMGHWNAQALGLGGWAISVQHTYDPVGHTLYMGDGSQRTVNGMSNVISTIAGSQSGALSNPSGVAADSKGNNYIADQNNNQIKKIDPSGNITVIAGTGSMGFSGDGSPAASATLDSPSGVAVDNWGNIYIADKGNNRIREINTNGIINTVAGNGTAGYNGDGGSAISAALNGPSGVAVDKAGNIYVADTRNNAIRQIDPSGVIVTVAGNGQAGYGGDGGPAAQSMLNNSAGIAVDRFGNIYIADTSNDRVREVNTSGVISTIAGIGTSCDTSGFGCSMGDGGPAVQAPLNGPSGVAVDAAGNVFIADRYYSRVRKVDSTGIITTLAGNGTPEYTGDNGAASSAGLNFPQGVAVDAAGNVYVADTSNNVVRAVKPPMPGASTQDISIPSEDGSEVYVFDASGRHLETVDAVTKTPIYIFGYDSSNHLISVTDRDGNVTTINRDSSGNISSIVAPGGQVTTIGLDGNGYLASIADPAGDTSSYAYTGSGLMTSETDAKGNVKQYSYDSDGRLVSNTEPDGGTATLSRAGDYPWFTVTRTTATGLTSTYEVNSDPLGTTTMTDVDPAGLTTVNTSDNFGTGTTTYPDGTVVNQIMGPDPRFGMQAPITNSLTVTTPSGLQYNETNTRTVNLSDPSNIFSFTTLTDTKNINGNMYATVYNALSRTLTETTPMGRQSVTTYNSKGHVISSQADGLFPINFGYDSLGQMTSSTQGTGSDSRVYSFNYDSQNHLSSIIDPMDRSTSFSYDNSGRMTQETLPDGRVINMGYDQNGNMTSITPPGKEAHTFDYTPVDLTKDYNPPALGFNGTTSYQYDLDRRQTETDTPAGSTIAPATDNTESTSFTYDGSLVTSTTWSGVVNGTVGFTFNNDFKMSSESLSVPSCSEPSSGAVIPACPESFPINFSYDKDGLITGAGSLTISRDPQTGFVNGSSLGNVTDSQWYNGFGELAGYYAYYNGNPILSEEYQRDKDGRITSRAETVNGATDIYNYSYNLAGRLTDVEKDNNPLSHYDYDSNGNRLDYVSGGAVVNGTYDAQDRLISYGPYTYTYTNSAQLASKTGPNGTTQYGYDSSGNLVTVIQPDGTRIDYVIDGQNRRVGKRINDVLVQGFLYENQLRPVAELDGNDNIISRFIYGAKKNVPDYMLKGGETYRIITDHLGSPKLVIDVNTGQVVQQMNYDEFGNVIQDTNPGFQPFGFAGGIYDKDTGLVRFGARDYDPMTGRWTAKDPIGFGGGDSNLFGYILEDPINKIDPRGLCSLNPSQPTEIKNPPPPQQCYKNCSYLKIIGCTLSRPFEDPDPGLMMDCGNAVASDGEDEDADQNCLGDLLGAYPDAFSSCRDQYCELGVRDEMSGECR